MYKIIIYNASDCVIFEGIYQTLEEINGIVDGFILYKDDTIKIEKMY